VIADTACGTTAGGVDLRRSIRTRSRCVRVCICARRCWTAMGGSGFSFRWAWATGHLGRGSVAVLRLAVMNILQVFSHRFSSDRCRLGQKVLDRTLWCTEPSGGNSVRIEDCVPPPQILLWAAAVALIRRKVTSRAALGFRASPKASGVMWRPLRRRRAAWLRPGGGDEQRGWPQAAVEDSADHVERVGAGRSLSLQAIEQDRDWGIRSFRR
jgi:hypothetical protein